MPDGGLRINRSQLQQVFGDDFEALRQFEVLMEQINDWGDVGFPASGVLADTTSFAGKLSSADDTVQKALDTLDDHIHDDRYYTETELDAGQLNTIYYTETEIDGFLASYYTAAQLDAGQLDTRYYTETEVDALLASGKETIVTTSTTESIDVETCTLIRQTASGITTSLSNISTGSAVTIKNRGGGDNTINLTIDGVASPLLADGDSVRLAYNGTDWDAL
jgi:gamma-glutamylcyclotransferase (GGCT)/AIG2-like uncharacterized protein YtfP